MPEKITAEFINSVWDEQSVYLDDLIGSSRTDFNIFIESGNHEQNIRLLIEHYRPLLKKHEFFFSTSHYDWCFDPRSYRLSAEVVFQFRVLNFLISLFEEDPGLYKSLSDEIIVVREAITGNTTIHPKTTRIKDISFITLPLGWFDHGHYCCFGFEMSQTNRLNKLQSINLGICAKILAEQAVEDFLFAHPEHSLDPASITLAAMEVAKRLIKNEPVFSSAVAEIGDNDLSDHSQIIAYACESFMLAHETAHIMAGDHNKTSFDVDEINADRVAFLLLNHSKHAFLVANISLNVDSLPVFAAQSFIFMGNALFQTHVELGTAQKLQWDKFHDRALAIQEVVKTVKLPVEDIKRLNTLTTQMQIYLKRSKEMFHTIAKEKQQILDNAYSHILDITEF